MELIKQGITPPIEEHKANQIKLEKERIAFSNFKSLTKTIEKDHKKHYNYLVSLLNFNSINELTTKLHLLYRGSEHNFDAPKFHQLCDGKGKTLVIVRAKTTKNLFGGYSTVAWHSNQSYSPAPGSFLFSLDKETKHTIIQNNQQYAIRGYPNYGPIFGAGNDLLLSHNCHTNTTSNTNFGHTYSLPPNISYNTIESKSYLSGSNLHFSVEEYEVFLVD